MIHAPCTCTPVKPASCTRAREWPSARPDRNFRRCQQAGGSNCPRAPRHRGRGFGVRIDHLRVWRPQRRICQSDCLAGSPPAPSAPAAPACRHRHFRGPREMAASTMMLPDSSMPEPPSAGRSRKAARVRAWGVRREFQLRSSRPSPAGWAARRRTAVPALIPRSAMIAVSPTLARLAPAARVPASLDQRQQFALLGPMVHSVKAWRSGGTIACPCVRSFP